MGFCDGSGISWTICKQSASRSTPTPHHSIFTVRVLFLTPTNCQSTEGKTLINRKCHSHLRVPHVGELFSLRRSLPRLAVVLDVRDGARSSSDLEIQTLYASSPGDV